MRRKKEKKLTGLRPAPIIPLIFPDGQAWLMQVIPKEDGSGEFYLEKVGECRAEELDLED